MKINIDNEKIVKWIMNEDCLNENGDLEVYEDRVAEVKEVLSKKQVEEIVNNLKNLKELEDFLMERLECRSNYEFGEILDEIGME